MHPAWRKNNGNELFVTLIHPGSPTLSADDSPLGGLAVLCSVSQTLPLPTISVSFPAQMLAATTATGDLRIRALSLINLVKLNTTTDLTQYTKLSA